MNNDEIAKELSMAFGTTLTAKSIENRIYRLKQMAGATRYVEGPSHKSIRDDTSCLKDLSPEIDPRDLAPYLVSSMLTTSSEGIPTAKGGKRRGADNDDDSDSKPVKKPAKRGKASKKTKVEEEENDEDDADSGAIIKPEPSGDDDEA